MTREENILWHIEMGLFHEIPLDDIRYILSRNEELQRRVRELEDAMMELQDDPYVYNVPRLVGIIQNAIDDTATNNENATSGGRG